MIIFIHIPGFYAAVEQADNHELRGQPVVVGGDPGKRGSVTGVSAEARKYGVEEGMDAREALERCPNAVFRRTRLKRYRAVAAETRALLRATTDRIEEFGVDGTFLEVPEQADALPLAAELCVRIQAELGLAAVAGIGPTRFVAHLGARHPGPGGIRMVRESDALAFLARFPSTEIWGLGPATAEKLAASGLESIGDLQNTPREEFEKLVGRNAARFHSLARGEDVAPLRPYPRAKSLSQERTLTEATLDLRRIGDELLELAGQLESVLVRERRVARTVTLGLAYVDGTQVTRTQTFDTSVGDQGQIGEAALQLLARTQAGARHVRRLRLQASNLRAADREGDSHQLRLF
jgi:DNA polymerase-4